MADPAIYNSILEENKQIQEEVQEAAIEAALNALAEEPWNESNWSLMPLLSNPTGCLCVYDSSSNYLRCGAACTWTVPSGTTKAQFQLWGAGAGTANGRCCAGSPFGATGAYATTVIDVTPGDTYTLCAGCAYCCYACCSSSNHTRGCPSYVTGSGVTGFCADGGFARISCGMRDFHENGCCRWRCNDAGGACICNTGSWYCFDNSCASCGAVPFIASTESLPHGTATGTRVYGLPSIYGGGCFDRNHYGWMISPPVISPCHTTQTGSCCCMGFSSGSCCGGCRCKACCGHRCYPGAGGTYTHMMGGSTAWSGDAGRGGMVRVTWC